MASVLYPYTVLDGDTVERIIARELGDVSRLAEIVALNDLRPPFISDDPLDRYGPPIYSYTIPGVVTAGTSGIAIPGSTGGTGTTAYKVRPGMIAYFEYPLPNGTLQYEASVVAYFDQVGGLLHIGLSLTNPVSATSGLTYTYLPGAKVYICLPLSGRGTVLFAGDTLLLPQLSGTNSAVAGQQPIDTFGKDILCYDGARVHIFGEVGWELQLDSFGDLMTVEDTANVAQALVHLEMTERDSDPYTPGWGSTFPQLIGKTNRPAIVNLYASRQRLELLGDPRVYSVPNVEAVTDGDTVILTAQVLLVDRRTLIVNAKVG